MRFSWLIFSALVLSGCLEPRIDKNAHPEKIIALKLFSNPAPAWAMHHIDMPQFTADEQRRLTEWLAEGKIETNPKDQNQDFQFISSLDKLLTTGETEDKVAIKRDLKLESRDRSRADTV